MQSLYGSKPSPTEYKQRIEEIVAEEARAIEYVFQRHKINACIDPEICVVTRQYFAFAIDALGGARGGVADVVSRQRELSNAITRMRGEETMVRIQEVPLMIEVPNPWPQPLTPESNGFDVGPDRMLAGVQYSPFVGKKSVVFDFNRGQHHFLVAGASGAGKSVLQNMMVLSLATGTLPKDLRMVLVDLKGQDLPKYARLPHVAEIATTVEGAERMIAQVRAELEWRKHNYDPTLPRLVLVFDELAEIRNSPDAVDALNSILALGRGLKVNCLLATQYPTKDTLGGVRLDNISVRISGSVADAKIAALVTGRPGTGAELLPLNSGAFVASYGNQAKRLQAYLLEDDAAIVHARKIETVCGKEVEQGQYAIPQAFHAPVMAHNHRRTDNQPQPVITSYMGDLELDEPVFGTDEGDAVTSYASYAFPIGAFRPLTGEERDGVRRLAMQADYQHQSKPSRNRLVIAVYGSKDPARLAEIDRALNEQTDNKVIRLPRRVAQ